MQNDLELVFYGTLVDGVSEVQAKQNIAQLFKADMAQIDRMFAGNRVVIRNKLDAETVQKYVLAMRKRGAICQIERMGAPGVAIDVRELQAPDVAASAPEKPVPTERPSAPAEAETQKPRPAVSASNPERLNVAGEKVDEILATVHLDLDPVGVRLSEHLEVEAPEFAAIDSLTIAPVGADLTDEKDEAPVAVPDTSHLSLKD